jgi:hypothetical protein
MILDNIETNLTTDMCVAVREMGFWNFIINYEYECSAYGLSDMMFKLDEHPVSDKYGYSCREFSICMQNVQYIARHGIEAHLIRDLTHHVSIAVRELGVWDDIKDLNTDNLTPVLRPIINALVERQVLSGRAFNDELLLLCLRNIHYFAKYDIDVYRAEE